MASKTWGFNHQRRQIKWESLWGSSQWAGWLVTCTVAAKLTASGSTSSSWHPKWMWITGSWQNAKANGMTIIRWLDSLGPLGVGPMLQSSFEWSWTFVVSMYVYSQCAGSYNSFAGNFTNSSTCPPPYASWHTRVALLCLLSFRTLNHIEPSNFEVQPPLPPIPVTFQH